VSIVQFIHEPHAALYGYLRSEVNYASMLRRYDRKIILVFDWGGGTVDLTLCRLADGMLVQIENDGTSEVGGDVFDETIKNEVVKRVYQTRNLDHSVKTHPDAMTRLLHQCERAKIELSQRTRVELYVPNFFRGVSEEELEFSLSREDLESMTASLLDKGVSRITKLLEAAGISTSQIALCLATGGMANMPTIRSRLHELFGPQRVHLSEKSSTMIAEGSAWIAHDEARLRLSKHVELLLARNSFMQLVKAGTEMPKEGEVQRDQFHLYCVDPRDGHANFQLQSPIRPGSAILPNDPRTPLQNMVLKVDQNAQPFRERIELDLEIDDNLILRAKARSLIEKDLAVAEVHNLEFGLALPSSNAGTEGDEIEVAHEIQPNEKAAIVLRANLSDGTNEGLVPGELLYSYNRPYFDRRNDPPAVQLVEQLYYKPCDSCGRDSNDPLCTCGPPMTQRRASTFIERVF